MCLFNNNLPQVMFLAENEQNRSPGSSTQTSRHNDRRTVKICGRAGPNSVSIQSV
uniref:Uncharacterized protein n=1 Tax=Anguilla anguilla TaxID=7936 RepID=A0A0E9RX98_ANGAN